MAFVHHRIGALPVMLHPQPDDGARRRPRRRRHARRGRALPSARRRRRAVESRRGRLGITSSTSTSICCSGRTCTLRVDDGRNFLLTTRKKYDVITADIILPRHAGAGSLYSREYYELVRNALTDDGLVMQWNGGDRTRSTS